MNTKDDFSDDLQRIVEKYAPFRDHTIESELMLLESIAHNLKRCKFTIENNDDYSNFEHF